MIDKPGVYQLSEAEYHADPCPSPSLSSSIARTLIARSPRHAWAEHPRLNPAWQPEETERFDIGKAAHALMLGSEARFAVIDADDWRMKEAKAARDEARKAGKIPLLAKQFERVTAMVDAGRAQLFAHAHAASAFRFGIAESTIVWREGETWCRARLDWKPASGSIFYDYKTTAGSAAPEAFGRTLYDLGYDVQAAFYRRGIRAVLNVAEPHFHFVVQETEPPYALSVVGLPPAALDMAERKVEEALRWWGWCLDNNSWPGYSARTAFVDPPAWAEKSWLEREERDALDRKEQGDEALFRRALDWQAPL